MWHTFILFTKPYADFCEKYFGHFIHHFPTTEIEREQRLENFDDFLNKDSQRMLSFVYDHLGEETLKTWFAEYFSETNEA